MTAEEHRKRIEELFGRPIPQKGKTILVVDDEPPIVQIVRVNL